MLQIIERTDDDGDMFALQTA